MKTKILSLALLSFWSLTSLFAQDRTTVTANNSDISDNLDLRAVASIFGDSRDLADFEQRLNDPKSQISNLDLNNDNRVDYLRVIETVDGNTHLIIIQSVLGLDTFQDIATVEVERDRYNKVQVQVVGDVYMYGNDYIYEPVYAYTPVIYTSFYVNQYRPYYSSWYWGYYPSFYVAWTPFPIYTYHSHIGIYINLNHHYNYVDYRRCSVAYNHYYNGRRGNAYERQYPSRSFAQRNTGYSNRRELVSSRKPDTSNSRNNVANGNTRTNSVASSPRGARTVNGSNEVKGNASPRSTGTISTRDNQNPRSVTTQNGREVTSGSSPRSTGTISTRDNQSPRSVTSQGNQRAESPRTAGSSASQNPRSVASQGNQSQRTESPRTYGGNSGNQSPRAASPNMNQRNESQRTYGGSSANQSPRSVASQGNQAQRTESPRTYGGSSGNQSPRAASPNMNQRNESQRSSNQREYSQQSGGSQRGGGNSRGGNGRG
jgi:hypothetical protein